MFDYIPNWLNSLLLPNQFPGISATLILVFLTMFLGIFIGKIKVKRISIGISGIVFIGILVGHFGYRLQEETYTFIRDFGLILFVYSIGMQVGPSFFSRLKSDGFLYNSLAAGAVIFGGLCTIFLFYVTSSGMDILVGIMSGAVTNTPGLGAAKTALHDIQIQNPKLIFADPTNAYAIAYPIGILGIILTMVLGKKIFRVDPIEEIKAFQESIRKKHPVPTSAKCRVTNPIYLGMDIPTFLQTTKLQVIVTRIKHSGSTLVKSPEPSYTFSNRDVLMLVGLPEAIQAAIDLLGYQSSDLFIESEEFTKSKTFLVSNNLAVQKSIGELKLESQYQVKCTRVYRTGIELLAQPDLILHFGDRIKVVGHENELVKIEKVLGNSEKKLQQPQLLSIFIGIVLGILVGSIPILLPGLSVPVKLGMAAGPLLVAIIISRFGGIRSFHSFLQQSALLLMKEFGICLFFAAIGIHAGASFYQTFVDNNGWIWVLYALFITLIPLFLMMLVARFVFKMNYMPLLGLIAGSYTDPAALDFSTSYFKSDLPLQAYATIYPLVTILRIVVAQLLVLYFAF